VVYIPFHSIPKTWHSSPFPPDGKRKSLDQQDHSHLISEHWGRWLKLWFYSF